MTSKKNDATCRLEKKMKEGKSKRQAMNELAGAGHPGAGRGDGPGKKRRSRMRQGDK